jgi:acetyltransferase-like isoleucine patch superfamily enzyme
MSPSISQVWNDGRAVARARWHLRKAEVVGDRVRLRGKPRVINLGRMQIGERVRLDSTTATLELVTEADGLLDIEERVFLNFGCSMAATKLIRIGALSQLGPHCMLMDNAYHHVEPDKRFVRPESKRIVLERNVWLGAPHDRAPRCEYWPRLLYRRGKRGLRETSPLGRLRLVYRRGRSNRSENFCNFRVSQHISD